MQSEKEFDVNVGAHAQRAADRTPENGTGLRIPQVRDEKDTLRERVIRLLPTPEVITVGNRIINKGLVVTPAMGLTIVLALGGIFGTMWWRMNDKIDGQATIINRQNELLIRLDQRLLDKGNSDDQRFQKIEHQHEIDEAWQTVTNRDLANLKAQRRLLK